MKKFKLIAFMVINQTIITAAYAALPVQLQTKAKADSAVTVPTDTLKIVNLPKPYTTKSVDRHSKVIGWPADKAPVASPGFTVTKFAEKLHNPAGFMWGQTVMFLYRRPAKAGVVLMTSCCSATTIMTGSLN